MISVDILRHRRAPFRETSAPRRFPWKTVIFLAVAGLVAAAIPFLWRSMPRPSEAPSLKPVVKKKHIQKLERTETPFDVVEDIVDDVYGGRFKVKSLYRLSSPVHLSPVEKKIYERFFIKNTFEALNAAVRPEMGFNTVSLDNLGNFFVFGLTPSRSAAEAFRKTLLDQPGFLSAEELEFKERPGQEKLLFALKGFLGYGIIDQFYDDTTWQREEALSATPRTVWNELSSLAGECGLSPLKNARWENTVAAGPGARHLVRFQTETSYGALMRWIRKVFERNLQVGYSRVTVVSVASKRTIVGLEMSVYAKQ